MIFLKFPCFLYNRENVGNLISNSSSFSKPSFNIWKFFVCIMLKPAAAAAAKSLQSCLTLWDPIDSSPRGSPVPGILQARTLEWVAISFSNAWKWKVKVKSLSRVRLFVTPTRLLRPWDSPGKSTGVGCHCLLQCWSLACKILSMILLAWETSAIVLWLAHSLVLPFLGIWMKIDLFQSCGHCWVFQICWHNECKILMSSSFRDLNSPAGISSHPLALLTTVLSKAHVTSHSRIFGSGWLTTPLE